MPRGYFYWHEFIKTDKYLSFNEKVRVMLKRVFDVLSQEDVDFVIKVGKRKE